jgi:ribosome recycling factor
MLLPLYYLEQGHRINYMSEYIDQKKEEFDKTFEMLQKELSSIRAGSASPALVESIMVDAYGNKTPIPQLASVSVPEPRQIVIQPWDASLLKSIEKAIADSDIGASPVNEGEVIRIVIPPLTEERRDDFVKQTKKKCEDSKVRIRTTRESIKDAIHKAEKDKEITEDEKYRHVEKLDAAIREHQDKVDSICQQKETEIRS